MACLDTTILLDLRGRGGKRLQARAAERIRGLKSQTQQLTTTIFNLAELFVGIERAEDRERERLVVEGMLRPLLVLGFDRAAARVFGQLTARLQETGEPVGDMDVLIASVALVNNEWIITRNTTHFARIPGLRIEGY